MKLTFFSVAIAAASLSTAFAQQPTKGTADDLSLRTPTFKGCYKSPGKLWDMGVYTFQAMGWCQPLCVRQAKQYLALVNGTNCFCGDTPPDDSDLVNPNECNMGCSGIKTDKCGGQNRWQVYDDGYMNGDSTGTVSLTTPAQTYYLAKSTSSASSSVKQATVVVTQSDTSPATAAAAAQSSDTSSNGSGPNKAVIAVAVVVSVVALAAIIGTAIFFIRHKKQRAFEEERRRHESMARFVTGEKPPSTYSLSDSRLEPSAMFQRRQSDGSIMDNHDYSRRILKVTNPDG